MTELDRWWVGVPNGDVRLDGLDRGGTVALTAAEFTRARTALVTSFAGAAEDPVPRAAHVTVFLPTYRGKALAGLLGWLVVERLARPGAEVDWYMTKQHGPDSIAGLLGQQGWTLDKRREKGWVRLRGTAPAAARPPTTRTFSTRFGDRAVTLAADYGVFSPERVDDGTVLLLDVVAGHPAVPRLADIGVGYGPLAIGLQCRGTARAAVGTDVDAIALWLAGENARRNGVHLDRRLQADPAVVEPTPLTVCNVPTHLPADESRHLLAGLVARGRQGSLFVVVHASLEERYARHLGVLGPLERHASGTHVVLGSRRT